MNKAISINAWTFQPSKITTRTVASLQGRSKQVETGLAKPT